MAGIPAQWSQPSADVKPIAEKRDALAAWWKRFNDPMLDALIVDAMDANTSIKFAAAALRQARALRDVAAAGLWPSLDGAASARRDTSGLKAGQRSKRNSFQAGLDANWTIDVFGASRNALSAAESGAWASAADLGDVQVQVAAEVGVTYILLRSAQARLNLAKKNLESQKDTLQITVWREQAGLSGSIETEQARASAEQTRAVLPLLQTTIDQTIHALAVLVGQPPDALTAMLSASGPIPQAGDVLVLRVPAETLRQRADVRAAEYRMAAALAQVRQARAARLPNFSIGGSIGLSSLTFRSLTDSASVASSLLAGVTLPIFNAGALRGRVQSQQAALDQTEQSYRATVLGALQDVEDALVALRDDRARLASLKNAADAGTNAATLARLQYASGLVDFQVVLETQRTELSTQDGVSVADAAVSADTIGLYKALGGGWREEEMTAAAAAPTRAAFSPPSRSFGTTATQHLQP